MLITKKQDGSPAALDITLEVAKIRHFLNWIDHNPTPGYPQQGKKRGQGKQRKYAREAKIKQRKDVLEAKIKARQS